MTSLRHLATLLLVITPLRAALHAQKSVPVSAEPRHHFQVANDYVRVYDVTVPPQDTTFFHTHAVDYTYVSLGSANLVAQLIGNDAAPLVLADGEVRFTRGPITHRVWNVGTTPFHNLTIELVHRDSAAVVPPPTLDLGDSLVLDNDRVRVVRRVIAPGATGQIRSRGLDVYLAAGRVEVAGTGAPRALGVQPGTFQWNESPGTRSVRNLGTKPLAMLTFSPK